MIESSGKAVQANLGKMKECLDQIEKRLLDLKKLGGEMPVIEKNVRAMMSFIHALKFGVSDMVDMEEKRGD
jgi:hypothetical protein